jgi:predicted PurR-regulated permease PerM
MPDTVRRRVLLQVPWSTLFKILTAVALVWLWLTLVQIVLLFVVSVLLAVTLNPAVSWLERRGLSRTAATTLLSLAILVVVGGFLWATWASLSDQGRYLAQHLREVQQQATSRLPQWAQDAMGPSGGGDERSQAGRYAFGLAQSLTTAVTMIVLAYILTIYLLIEGQITYEWLLAFVPRRHQAKVDQTARECERVIFGYMAGNFITSVIAAISTLIVLTLLKVPAALLLALMAGLSDFVPVIGFIVSSIPAILLAFTVSTTTALIVVAFYIAYNAVEQYLLAPWAYGNRLKLSNVAVILAFAIGAQAAGIIGALIALPIAALYSPIERIWLRRKLGDEVVERHRAIESEAAG